MSTRRIFAALLFLLWIGDGAVVAQSAGTAGQQPPAPRSLDQQLLEGLDPPPSSQSPAKVPPQAVPAGEDVGQPTGDSPLAQIGKSMRQVEERLRGKDLSPHTRDLQDRIAAELGSLIQELEQQQTSQSRTQRRSQNSASGGGEKSDPSDQQGTTARRGDGQGQPDAFTRWSQGVWGTLPDRIRQQIQNAGNEEFLPAFERIIQDYYDRLAERANRTP